MAAELIDERLRHLPPAQAAIEATTVLAAQPPEMWAWGVNYIEEETDVPSSLIRAALADTVHSWNSSPRQASEVQLRRATEVKDRLIAPGANASGQRPTRERGISQRSRAMPQRPTARGTRPTIGRAR